MAAVLVLTPILFPTPKPVPGSTAIATDSLVRGDSASTSAVRAASASAPTTGAAPNSATASTIPVAAAQGGVAVARDSGGALIPVDTTAVATARAVYRVTNRGAALIGAEMTQYPTLKNRSRTKGDPVELANVSDHLLSFRLVLPGDTVRLDQQLFKTTRGTDNGRTTVRYDALVAQRAVSITYSFLPDSYRVNIAAQIDGAPESSFLLVDMPPGFRSAEADTAEDATHLAYAYKPDKQSAKGVTFHSLDPGERKIESGPITWVVAKNKYFLIGLLTPMGAPAFAELDVTGGVRTGKVATRAQATVIMPLKGGKASMETYAGPQEFARLVAVGREFETSNPYGGWLQGVVQPFATIVIRLLLLMKEKTGLSYGWILVLFGVTVRILLWPLNQRAMRSSMAMQRIQPELAEIQAKFKGDPQKLQAAMMEVYKAHGMSPFSSLSGCLPMLIPLPVFFALFFVFQNTIEFRGVSFLWLPDISIKDPFYVLPIAVAITAIGLSYIGMKGVKANEQQKIMMYMMPAMMLFIFLNMAGGLNLYYLVQNLASLPQQWLIARERGKAKPVVRG